MKVLIAGDFLPKYRIQELIDNRDYSMMNSIRSVTDRADYSIVNLECPIVTDGAKPIEKGGPNHGTTIGAVEAIKYAGFDCVTLANNHFRDFGDTGCCATIEGLRTYGLDIVGGGLNLNEAQKVMYKNIGGKILSVVNICENEFSIATTTRAGSAPLDAIDNYNQIIEARQNSDYVLVIVHGGHEHYQLPSPRMKKTYRHFIELGADAVVNHHQHCYSGFETFNGKPILYGLGNLCFDSEKKRSATWYEGYMVTIDFRDKYDIAISLQPYHQCKNGATISLMDNKDTEEFHNKIKELNSIISNDELLALEFDKFVDRIKRSVKLLFASYHNKYLNGAARRGYLPILISDREMRINGNCIRCESHLDVVQHVLFRE